MYTKPAHIGEGAGSRSGAVLLISGGSLLGNRAYQGAYRLV
ncbi:hypothetical protein [Paenibacillus sp. 7541]|nr:hypothetical protein [Paenibacillus sp. 7541]